MILLLLLSFLSVIAAVFIYFINISTPNIVCHLIIMYGLSQIQLMSTALRIFGARNPDLARESLLQLNLCPYSVF